MFLLREISSSPYQRRRLVLEDGSEVALTLYFRPMQYGWYIEEISRLDFTLRGIRISNSPNMLRQWGNLIPFGLACITEGGREPTQQEDFFSGASKLYILSAAEVQEYQDYLELG